jgi:gliding motility-associated-like protein
MHSFILRSVVFIALFLFFQNAHLKAQSGLCDSITPFFTVNLTGNPSGTWVSSPPVARAGLCCTNTSPDRCIEFSITLDPQAVAINFQIASGAVPPGAMYYQIGCGPPTPVGQPICINGPGPHTLTFCKPGNNQNTYAITSVSGPVWANDITIGDGCNVPLQVSGLVQSTITWNSIFPGTSGQYNSYLSCTSGCATTVVTPQSGYPSYVDYVVCGVPDAQPCTPPVAICDTVRVYFVPPLNVTINPNPAAYCENDPGILLTANATGGDSTYNYIWTDSSGNIIGYGSTYFATNPGTYNIQVQDGTYPTCPAAFSSVTVTEDPSPIVIANNNLICGGGGVVLSGSISNGLPGVWSGGNGTYSPNANTINGIYFPTPAEVAAGYVNLILTSQGNGGCPDVSDVATITFVSDPVINIVGPTSLCSGTTGSLFANITGGTAPFSFSWNTGAITQSITVSTSGTYTVTVIDASGCTKTASVTVVVYPPLLVNASPSSTIACNSSITISASASGGAGVYSYLWNTGQTSSSINVFTGTYIVTVTDTAGCSATDTVSVIASNSTLDVVLSGPANICFGATATITSAVSGGFGNYYYSWNTGSTNTSVSGGGGNYCLTVTDDAGCINTVCQTVVENPLLTVNIPTSGVICNGASVSINANVAGGTPGYTFLWSNGSANQTTTVVAGTYSVIVTDAMGCTATASVTVTQSAPLTAQTSVINHVSCFNGSDGAASVSAQGGTAPYIFTWAPYGGLGTTATNLAQGTFTITVMDQGGCVTTAQVSINQPSPMQTSIASTTPISCYGGSNGSATLQTTGGTAPYTYNWTPINATGATVGGLSAGNYIVNATDFNGCATTTLITITQPTEMVFATPIVQDVTCFLGNNGSASVSVSGGTPTYTYLWSNGATGSSIANATAGQYTVVATDNNGCTQSIQLYINQPGELWIDSIITQDVLCVGGNDGEAVVFASEGTPPYTYTWNPSVSTGSSATGLSAGNYFVTVSDIHSCNDTASFTINQPANGLSYTANVTHNPCFGNSLGAITINPSGGVGAYAISWTNGSNSFTISNLAQGQYIFTLTDTANCSITDTILITEPDELILSAITTDVICAGQADGSASLTTIGGTPSYTYVWPNSSSGNFSNTLAAGNYEVVVIDQNNCSDTVTFTINEPDTLVANVVQHINVSCFGYSDGLIEIAAQGGNTPYTYSWSPITSTNSLVSGLAQGTYTYTVTDDKGCLVSGTVIITEPQQIVSFISPVTPICQGQSVTLQAFATGGSGTYNFNWDQGLGQGSTHVVSPTVTTTYNLIVTDNNGCSGMLNSITVQVYTNPVVVITGPQSICYGDTATISASVTGGDGNYTYTWSNPAFNGPGPFAVSPTSSITYYLTVTDGCGTTGNDSLFINVYPYPIVVFSPLYAEGCAPLTVQFRDSVTSEPGSTYFWSFGDNSYSSSSSPIHTYNTPGSYTVSLTVTSPNGCVSLSSPNGIVNVYDSPIAGFNVSPEETDLFNPDVTFSNTSIDAISYLWNFGDGDTSTLFNPLHTYEDTGTFVVTLIAYNQFGCPDSVKKKVRINPVFSFFIPNTFTPNGDRKNETFMGIGIGIEEYEMYIFDRWGELIFVSNQYGVGWDGRKTGYDEICQQDTYVYKVKIRDVFKQTHEYYGHVNLIH